MFLEYRSLEDLNNVIINNLFKFPHDIDLIVGIPRSGMLPANLLALYLNKPFTDIDSFVEGKIYSSGERGKFINLKNTKKVLIVDDSIDKGGAKNKAELKLKFVSKQFNIIYAVIYATSKSASLVNIFCEIIDSERVFQWNLFHHKSIISCSCFDIDGVLCRNPPIDDDGPIYSSYIRNAEPYIIPSIEIDTIVSCRLEKYRELTEAWLKEHGVKYKHLVMLNLKTKRERLEWNKHGEYKGEIYKKSKNILFIESSLEEAETICKVSGKQVFCTENFKMLYKNEKVERRNEYLLRRKHRFVQFVKSQIKRLIFK